MFRPRSGSPAGRGLLLLVVPLVAGVAVLQATDVGSRRPTTRLEATQAPIAAPVPDAPGPEPGTAAPADNVTPGDDVGVIPAARAGSPQTTTPPLRPAGDPAPATTVPWAEVDTRPTTPATATTIAPVPTTTTTVAPTITTTTTAAPRGPVRSAGAESEVVPLTNADRRASGLGPLSRDACLDGVASRYAEQMARAGVLAHNPGAGPAVNGCKADVTWGDNVGTAAPCDTTLLEQKWMASPSHRQNILTPVFQRIGVGAWTDDAGGCWVQVLFSS